ncbi:MAG: hypothetical protein HKM93_23870 [Desulfobacteraceae bacterium]|nr:hypothetical protein [Desulfobacteraceae bacterium]
MRNSTKSLICLLLLLMATGCATGTGLKAPERDFSPLALDAQIRAESEELAQTQEQLRQSVERTAPVPEIIMEPVVPTYDPLEDHIVSFSMVDEDIQMVLYSLSKSVGMNLIMDPSITAEKRRLTMNFEEVSAAVVLKEILNIFDFYYETDKSIIRIKPFQERIFRLNFLDSEISSTFDVGGDVLGAGQTESASGLTGSFKLSGQGSTRRNTYDTVQEMVQRILSGNGKFSLNRVSGTLYVKDTPAVIKTVSRLIGQFKEMLSRQILIEARIIEVILSDEHRFGINWSVVKDLTNAATELTRASWSSGSGLILNGASDDYTIGSAIDALNTFGDAKVVSNPTLRSKHGKPAMISVGTSFTYKKSVKVTQNDVNNRDEETTEVEVSTVFDGLILGVVPFIEPDGRVNLLINPIKSDVDRASLVPENVGTSGANSISLPEVSIKEISTTISLDQKDVVILGGLIDKRRAVENKNVPVISRIPVLGYLFKNELEIEETRELVIILSTTVI